MNLNDFRYMWRGKVQQSLSQDQMHLLAAIDQRTERKERAILLLHGFSSSPAVYRRLLPSLTLYDAVVCPVLPGHGQSIEAFGKIHAQQWIDCAEQTCRELVAEYEAVDVLGLSLGGLLACHLSGRFALNHVYLLAPALAIRSNLNRLLRLARLAHSLGFQQISNRAGNLHTREDQELAYRKLPVATAIELLCLIRDFKFAEPACPIDLFLGAHDAVVDSDKVAALFAANPNARIHWLAHSAHVLPLDGDLDAIVGCIEQNWKPLD